MTHPLAFALSAFLLMPLAAAADSSARIENSFYAVTVGENGSFSVQSKATGKTFLTDGRLSGQGGKVKTSQITDKTFGNGNVIEVAFENGNREAIALYPGLPFVLFRATLHNGAADAVVLNHVQGVSTAINLDCPADKLKTLGTGGLLAPDKNPGSYAFLTVVDPDSRSGVVGGWITHDRGSGVVFSEVKDGAVRMRAQIDYGRLRIQPGKAAAAETFAIGYFDDARLGLEAYADAIAKAYAVKLPPQYPGYCTWYMEKNAGACDEVHLAELADYAAKNLKPFGLDFIQIDDQWQEGTKENGPKKNFTTHAPSGPYRSGMKPTADMLKTLGFTPGIWFMPFAGNYKDPFFKDHQDWFVKTTDGKPYDTVWGGTCLDMTHAGAREHVRSVVRRIAQDWGYWLFKMDGFWTGSATKQIYVNDGYRDDGIGDAVFSNPDKTNIEALRDGVRLVREAAGKDVFLLGCCVSQNMRSFGGSFGLLDAMRVGPDTGAGTIGAPHASRLWFLNGRVWWNDPDCVSVRRSTPLDQARLNATFTTIAGDLFYNSDWMPDFPPERLDIVRRCIPSHGLQSRPVDVFESPVARIWHVSDTRTTPRRDIVALYNWDKASARVSCSAKRIGLPAASEYVGFDFWSGKFVPPFRDEVRADLPPGGSCRVLAIRPVSDHPQLVSTSRHITQGMIDVTGENWDAGSSELSGGSKLVANDPYELRIVVPVGQNSWRAKAVSVSNEDAANDVKAKFTQDGPKLRVTLTSPASREVKWTVQFERGPAVIELQPVINVKARPDYLRIFLSWDENGADSYRVTCSDGRTFTVSEPSLEDTAFPRGKMLTYRVEAIGWDGSASASATVEVTPMAELKVPAAPPLPTVYLDDLKPTIKANGWGKPGIGRSVDGHALTVAGKTYEKGLGLHAKSLVLCPVPPDATRFVAHVGIDDEKKKTEPSSIVFEVYGDVKEMGEPPVLLGQSPTLSTKTLREWNFNIELNPRVKELRLVITDAGDGIAADHGDWVNAGFIVSGK